LGEKNGEKGPDGGPKRGELAQNKKSIMSLVVVAAAAVGTFNRLLCCFFTHKKT